MARKPDVKYIHYVTDGSAARVLQPVAPKPKTRLPKVKKPKAKFDGVIRMDPLASVAILLSAVMLVLLVVSCFQLRDYQLRANAMDRYVDYLKSENARLTHDYRETVDLDAIEEQALALGLVPVEEVQHLSVTVERDAEYASAQTALTGLASNLTP